MQEQCYVVLSTITKSVENQGALTPIYKDTIDELNNNDSVSNSEGLETESDYPL
jgi:hypothetical protein